LATPNYAFEKRQRDLEKKKKQEEKRLRKQAGKATDDTGEVASDDVAPPSPTGDVPSVKP
jgi:hypothetical protein